jgi:hypothetical protein
MVTARPSRRHNPCDSPKPALSRENGGCDGCDTGPEPRHTRPESPLKPASPTQQPTPSQPVPAPSGVRPPETGGRDGLVGPQAHDTTIRDSGTGPPRTRPAVPNPSERTHHLTNPPNPSHRPTRHARGQSQSTTRSTATRSTRSAQDAAPATTRPNRPAIERTSSNPDTADTAATERTETADTADTAESGEANRIPRPRSGAPARAAETGAVETGGAEQDSHKARQRAAGANRANIVGTALDIVREANAGTGDPFREPTGMDPDALYAYHLERVTKKFTTVISADNAELLARLLSSGDGI